MRWRWLLLPTLLVPAALEVACSASNGASIGGELRDAEALDASTPDPTDRDSSSPTDEDADTPDPIGGSRQRLGRVARSGKCLGVGQTA